VLQEALKVQDVKVERKRKWEYRVAPGAASTAPACAFVTVVNRQSSAQASDSQQTRAGSLAAEGTLDPTV
jgi:hypothetical protein